MLRCFNATLLQKLIFERPPPNVRKIVLATNMAEASITINDVVFVVDCGKAKETTYDALNNTPCLLPSWISKASMRQVNSLISISFNYWNLLLALAQIIISIDPLPRVYIYLLMWHANYWEIFFYTALL